MTIEGIVLTRKAIQMLSDLQECDNAAPKSCIRNLTGIAKGMAIESQFNPGKEKEVLSEITCLFGVCDLIQSLSAEQEGGAV